VSIHRHTNTHIGPSTQPRDEAQRTQTDVLFSCTISNYELHVLPRILHSGDSYLVRNVYNIKNIDDSKSIATVLPLIHITYRFTKSATNNMD
jgi:hypothetical protein